MVCLCVGFTHERVDCFVFCDVGSKINDGEKPIRVNLNDLLS